MVAMHSKYERGAFHEPQGAAGILPAEGSENSPADETSAAPCSRHCPILLEVHVPKHGRKAERLSMNRASQIRMTNDEIRKNDEIRTTKPAASSTRASRHSSFGFLSSFVIRYSSFNDPGSWSRCTVERPRGLPMNLGWFGVPPSGGSNGLDRLKPGLHAVRGSRSQGSLKSEWRNRRSRP